MTERHSTCSLKYIVNASTFSTMSLVYQHDQGPVRGILIPDGVGTASIFRRGEEREVLVLLTILINFADAVAIILTMDRNRQDSMRVPCDGWRI